MSEQSIVVGFHRSGTSLICRMLHRTRLFLGYDLLGPDASNPHGHFEDVEIPARHKPIRAGNGQTRQVATSSSPVIAEHHQQPMEHLIEPRDANHELWGFEDPRVCLLLEEWRSLLLPGAKD